MNELLIDVQATPNNVMGDIILILWNKLLRKDVYK